MTDHKTIEELLQDETKATTQILPEESNSESVQESVSETSESQEVTGYSSETVIELLKKSLNIHWQQTTVLTAQAVHLDRWGYKKLAAVIKEDAEEEHNHAAINLQRLEFFDIDYQPLNIAPPNWNRHDMAAMLKYNLNSVREAAAAEKATITAARSVGDELTANIMIPLLQGSENGIEFYESQLKLINQMGLDNYLSLQV